MEALGINLQWFLFQLGNFTVLFLGLTFLLHKPLIKLLDKRREEIEQGLENAKAAAQSLATSEEQRQAILDETRQQSTVLLKQAKQQAEALEASILAAAREKESELAAKTAAQFEAEKGRLRQEFKEELADMVVASTEKVLRASLDKDDKKRAHSQAIDHLKS